ncbi:MAG: PDZ domain-containing protein [Ruminococcaceae bacterium]|nr:PDZ domain-containing protein [Oscillospiraceae bacterium]
MKKTRKLLALLLSFMMLLSAGIVSAEDTANLETIYYQQVMNTIMHNHPFEVNTEDIARAVAKAALAKHPELLEELIAETVGQLDDYTTYLTQEETTDFSNFVNAEYVGIGVSIERIVGAIEVTGVFSGSPAEQAGISAGDRFIQVDGQDVTDYNVNQLMDLVRGEAGTTVQLTMERDGKRMEFLVARAAVEQNSVNYAEIEPGMGYLQITIFNGKTPSEIKEADKFFRERKIKKIMIDLRDNPGGELLGVVGALGYFVPNGKNVVSIRYGNEARNTTLRSVGGLKSRYYTNIAVLVNENSASGAELFAGNIRDHGLGKLVGCRTFGKGTVQEFVNLMNNDAHQLGTIKLTTAEYYLPGGDRVHDVGIYPQYNIENRVGRLDTSAFEPMQFAESFQKGDSGKAILALKQRFSALGYYVGEIDDQYDGELVLSVKQFQQGYGLPVSGVMDMDTQTLFSSTVNRARVTYDDQYDRAYELLKTGR